MEGKVLLGKYVFGKFLGKGSFGRVYKSMEISSGKTVAIKIINKYQVKELKMTEHVKREITVMSLVKHANIVELIEVMATKINIYLVMEYVGGGDLHTKVCKERKLGENLARKLFQQLITAVDYCHSRGVCHRDLKLENILLDSDGQNLKLADFGLATLPEESNRNGDGILYTPCGALAYMAPDILQNKGYYGKKTDMWSCGVTLFALVNGGLPFEDKNQMRLTYKILVGKFGFPGNNLSEEIRNLIKRILVKDPKKRITMFELMSTPWFKVGYCHPYESIHSGEGLNLTLPRINFNAFDFIQLMAPGLDLSGLFERRFGSFFVTSSPVNNIINTVKNMAMELNYNVFERELMTIALKGEEVGRKGKMVIGVQIFEVTWEIRVVGFSRWAGDHDEYEKLMEEEVKPAMKEVVWKWQGDWIHHGRNRVGSVAKRYFGLID